MCQGYYSQGEYRVNIFVYVVPRVAHTTSRHLPPRSREALAGWDLDFKFVTGVCDEWYGANLHKYYPWYLKQINILNGLFFPMSSGVASIIVLNSFCIFVSLASLYRLLSFPLSYCVPSPSAFFVFLGAEWVCSWNTWSSSSRIPISI